MCGAIKNVDLMIEGNKLTLNSFRDGNRSYTSSYSPELDVNDELDVEFTNRFQKITGVLRWSIELGRIDIMT